MFMSVSVLTTSGVVKRGGEGSSWEIELSLLVRTCNELMELLDVEEFELLAVLLKLPKLDGVEVSLNCIGDWLESSAILL